MSISLTFDAQAMYNDLMDELLKAMNDLINEFYRSATQGFDAPAMEASEKIPAHLSDTTEYNGHTPIGDIPEYIVTQCKFYADAIMKSFGTGVYADTSSDSYWNQYRQSELWNKSRSGIAIVGRPKGKYTNIYGEETESSGRNRGKNVEGYTDKDGNLIESKPGTHSIQTAEAWIMKDSDNTKIERRIELIVTKFLTERASDYFREVNV